MVGDSLSKSTKSFLDMRVLSNIIFPLVRQVHDCFVKCFGSKYVVSLLFPTLVSTKGSL